MIIDFEVSALEEQIKQAVIEDLGDDFATVSGTVASAAYISSSTTIDFYNGDGQVISQVDASDFIVDGMVDDVYISGNTLYIVFNTDAGKQTIEVEIPSVFNPDNYYTKAETDAAITAATQNLATEAYVDAAVTAATEDMATEAYVDAAITAATEDLATESYVDNAITAATEDLASESYVDNAITAATEDLVSLEEVEAIVTAATQDYVTSGDVKTQIEAYNYLTSADTQDFVTSGDVKSQIEGYNYVTSGDVKTQVEAYGYLTSADTENFVTSGDVKSQIEGYNYITSGDAQSQIEAATADFVTSGDVETQITSKGYATEAYVTGATSGLQETLVSGTNIKTVGGNSLLGSGNIPWPAVDTVLATGSTNAIENGTVARALELKANKSDIPTKVGDLENDEGYLTSADTQDFVTSGDVKSQIEAYDYITSGDAKSQIEAYDYAPLEVSTPYSAVSTSAEYFFGLTPLDKSDYIDGTAMSIAQDGKIFYHQTVTTGYLPCIYYTDGVEVAGFMGLVTGGSTPLVYGEPYALELAGGVVGLDDAYNNELLPSDFWAVIDGSSISFYNAVPEAVKTVVYSDQLTPGEDWATEEYVDNAITAATQNLVTSGQVQAQITAATQNFVTSGDVQDVVDAAVSAATVDFVTTGDVQTIVDTAVSAATEDFVTTGDVQTIVDAAVSAATEDYVTSGDVANQISAATEDFVTSGDVEAQITAATADFVTSGDVASQVEAYNYITSGDAEAQITAATADFVTSGDVESQISAATSDFVTSGDVESQITAATADFVTSGDVENQITAATADFVTSGDVENQITAATADFVTSGDVENQITSATADLASEDYVDNSITAATQSLELTGVHIGTGVRTAPGYATFSGTTSYADGNSKSFDNWGALDAASRGKGGSMRSYDYITLEALRKKIPATEQIQRAFTTGHYQLRSADGSSLVGDFYTCQTYGLNLNVEVPYVYGIQLTSSFVACGTTSTFSIYDTTSGLYYGNATIDMGAKDFTSIVGVKELSYSSSLNTVSIKQDATSTIYLWLDFSRYGEGSNKPLLYVGWQNRIALGYADASALLTSGDIKTVQSKSLIGTGNQDLFVSLTQAEYDALVQAGTVDTAITYYITDAPAPVTSGDVQAQITAATQNFVTSGQVQSQITAATQNFVTSGDVQTVVDDAVSAATVDFVTSGDVQTVVDDAVSAATADFVTSGDVQTVVDAAVSAATADYVTSGDVQSMITADTSDCVRYYDTSGPYLIRTLSQSEYDQLSEPEETTLYIIVN